jgi:DUF4097 and DUF4098 domain-containing protein YvlB
MHTFETPTPVRLKVRNPAGHVEIQSIDGARSEIEILPLKNDEASIWAAEETAVERRSDGEFILEVDVPKTTPELGTAHVHVIARVPHGSSLHIASNSADVDAHGSYGAADVMTASGDIHFDHAADEAHLESASGDISVESIGGSAVVQTASGDIHVERLDANSKIQTASGDIRVGEARSSLKVQSASGDQSIDTVSEGRISLQSSSGDLRVGVKRGSILWIDARSVSGETTSELEASDAPEDGSGPILEVNATTMSGDVLVVRSEDVRA